MRTISISKQQKKEIMKEFGEYLDDARLSNNKISYQKNLDKILKKVKKPNIHFSVGAYMKMLYLIEHYKTEIAWHGTVHKSQNNYFINEIMVYPQEVTAATANAPKHNLDYEMWLMNQPDDVLETIRFQGHSHVNMPTGPSGTDKDFYNAILQSLDKNDFYIFAIMNKRNELNIWIYDYEQNIIFDKEDINLHILEADGTPINTWFQEQKKLVKEPKIAKWQLRNIQDDETEEIEYLRQLRNIQDDETDISWRS